MDDFTLEEPTEVPPVDWDAEFKGGLSDAVYTALGAASTCWSEPASGVFDDVRAAAIGAALLRRISAELGERTLRVTALQLAPAAAGSGATTETFVGAAEKLLGFLKGE